MVIERLIFMSCKVYLGEISNILFETVFLDIKLSQLESILLPNES